VLLKLYAAACHAVDGRRRVRAALSADTDGDWWVLAIGKAASRMTLGAFDALGERITRALVVTRADHFDDELTEHAQIELRAGDHPLPGAASLAAGEAVLEFARAAPPQQRMLVLVSGGASSLVEALVPGVTPQELHDLNAWALASGVDIRTHNALRRRISRLKGGRLAARLAHTRGRALLISDVPDDDPGVIGSGLVSTVRDDHVDLPESTPNWLRELLDRLPAPAPGASLPLALVGTLDDALAAAERAAVAQGFTTRRLPGRASGDVLACAHRFAHEFALSTEDVVLWGGETTVVLPPTPGRGGRNQHLALAAARLLAWHRNLVLLAAGTDGTDGNTDDAGAIVDGATLLRAKEGGCRSADDALTRADAGTFLEASGDLLYTGPTGTNVGDVLIALRQAPPLEDEADEADGQHVPAAVPGSAAVAGAAEADPANGAAGVPEPAAVPEPVAVSQPAAASAPAAVPPDR
jgi:hydroxypyruvate reductase